jgi:hypothetical protein
MSLHGIHVLSCIPSQQAANMAFKMMKVEKHGCQLLSSFAGLFDNPVMYCDVKIQVGAVTFQCHKLILALQSSYFRNQLFENSSQTAVHQLAFKDVSPEDFKNVLLFMYKGEIQLNSDNVGRMIRLAKSINLNGVKEVCFRFMKDTMDVYNCVQYWKCGDDKEDAAFRISCLLLFISQFDRVTTACDMRDVPQELLEAAVERDDLNVSDEMEVCETIMKWFESNLRNGEGVAPLKLLSEIRWSAVPIEYIKSTMIVNEILVKDSTCVEHLSKVISYRLSGIQFKGLHTNHRPSTGVETCVVIFGTNSGGVITAASHRISLQQNKSVGVAEIPTKIQPEAAACVINNLAYVSGIGASCKETWKWDPVGGWARCGDMVEGRRRHCTTFVNSTSMYAFGGFVDSTKTTLSSVEHFDEMRNKWKTVGKLVHAVNSAGCASYKTSVYLFGGRDEDAAANKDVELDCIQVFDMTTKQCSVLSQRLPRGEWLLRAVLWETSVILMSNRTCLIFDLNHHNIQQRDQFKADVSHFGLVLNNQTLFVIGGGTWKADASGKCAWTCTDEVKYVPVDDIVRSLQTVKWTQHATKLTLPSLVAAYALMTISAV